ncbi:MAG: hypothetical protein EU539_13550, partial [Promethearchaeota archaeon]
MSEKKTISSIKDLSSKLIEKFEMIFQKLIRITFRREIYTKGKEPPKSFAFEKKFFGIYILFFFYSFVLFLGINDPNNLLFIIFMFGNPFAFANAMLFFFLTLSILLNIDEFRIFLFENNSRFKQPLIYGLIITLYLFLFTIISTSFNLISFFLFLNMIWVFLLSSRFYTLSRKAATKIEIRFISRYSPFRSAIALITPFIIIAFLVILSLIYRGILVFISLDFFAQKDPGGAIKVYDIEMRLIMPLIYFSLVLTLVFIIFEFVFTRRRAETKRAGSFDNFTFSFMVFFIFFFEILQMTIYLLLQPETISALRNTVGTTSNALTYLFLIEFAVSMMFLYRIIIKLGKTFGWRVLFFKRDGLIIFFLTCIFAQTLTAFSLSSQIENQEITLFGEILLANRFIVSLLMILFIGITLILYYMKPHETSMFLRMQKETVSKEEKSMDVIYKLIKTEYIRRGEPYPIEILERELIKATKLPKGLVYSLIKRLENQKVDIKVSRKKDNSGRLIHEVNFLSITEQFEKKEIADKKAKAFLSKRLIETISSKGKKSMNLARGLDKDKPSDQFIDSLTKQYSKKQEHKKIKAQQPKQKISFAKKELPESLVNRILEILKNEYIYRIENTNNYPEIIYPISHIVNQINLETNISVGEIYPIIERISRTDLELKLISNPEEPEDKRISFFPIASDHVNQVLLNFRPEEYAKVKAKVIKKLIPNLKQKTSNAGLASIKRKLSYKTEIQKCWRDLIDRLFNYYKEFTEQLLHFPEKNK